MSIKYLRFWTNVSVDFQLVAERAECDGDLVKNVIDCPRASAEECAESCRGDFSMFSFGRPGESSCSDDGRCKCYSVASPDGTCTQESIDSYNLYRFYSHVEQVPQKKKPPNEPPGK